MLRTLQEAVEHTTITAASGIMEPVEAKNLRDSLKIGDTLSLGDYRKILELEEYLPGISREIISSYRLNTAEVQMKKLASEIAKIIQIDDNQHIFSSPCVVMGGQPYMNIEDISEKLIQAAIRYGATESVEGFKRSIKAQIVRVKHGTLAVGVTVPQEIEICSDLIITPNNERNRYLLPFDIRRDQYNYPSIYTYRLHSDSSIVISDHTISPPFKIVEEDYESSEKWFSDVSTTMKRDKDELPGEEATNILSLILNHPVIVAHSWLHIDPYEPFYIQKGLMGSTGYLDIRLPHQSVQATVEDFHVFTEIRQKLLSSPELTKKLKNPIRYWVKSKVAGPSVDGSIYMGIAMETLFLDGSSSELSYRMTIRAAKLLRECTLQRKEIVNQIKDAYDIRSKAAHGGMLRRGGEQAIQKGQDLIREAILKIINSGTYPRWDYLDIE